MWQGSFHVQTILENLEWEDLFLRSGQLDRWKNQELKISSFLPGARKPVWPQKKSYVHVFRNMHTCIDYCRGKVLRIYWYILSALTIYIDVTSPSFCGRSQLCNDPDTYQALGSVERRHRIYEEKYEWKNHDVFYVTTWELIFRSSKGCSFCHMLSVIMSYKSFNWRFEDIV